MLNVAGFYNHFLAFLDHAVTAELIKAKASGDAAGVTIWPAGFAGEDGEWKGELGKRWMTPEQT